MAFGEKLRHIRKQKRLTQKELGSRLGVSASMVAQYENNLRNPKYGTVEKIAKALECDISELLTPHEESEMIINQLLEWSDAGNDSQNTGENEMVKIGAITFRSDGDRLSYFFECLNDEGKRVAADRVQELTEIPKYRRKREPGKEGAPDEP